MISRSLSAENCIRVSFVGQRMRFEVNLCEENELLWGMAVNDAREND